MRTWLGAIVTVAALGGCGGTSEAPQRRVGGYTQDEAVEAAKKRCPSIAKARTRGFARTQVTCREVPDGWNCEGAGNTIAIANGPGIFSLYEC